MKINWKSDRSRGVLILVGLLCVTFTGWLIHSWNHEKPHVWVKLLVEHIPWPDTDLLVGGRLTIHGGYVIDRATNDLWSGNGERYLGGSCDARVFNRGAFLGELLGNDAKTTDETVFLNCPGLVLGTMPTGESQKREIRNGWFQVTASDVSAKCSHCNIRIEGELKFSLDPHSNTVRAYKVKPADFILTEQFGIFD